MSASPLITVIIPSYNQSVFLSNAIDSLIRQSYAKWEAIIIDDGSSDDTKKLAEGLLKKDSRLQYFRKENGGLASARNFGLEKAAGDYVQFLDADDYLDERKFELSVQLLDDTGIAGEQIVISNFVLHDEQTSEIKPPYCNLDIELINFESILYQWDETFSIPIHCGLFDAQLFKHFRFPESIKAKEDWIMWIYLMKFSPGIKFIDKPLAVYRIHTKSMTMSGGIFEEHMRALEYLKNNVLSLCEYVRLLEVLLPRFYRTSIKFKMELIKFQQTNFYTLLKYFRKLKKKLIPGSNNK